MAEEMEVDKVVDMVEEGMVAAVVVEDNSLVHKLVGMEHTAVEDS